MTSTVANGSGEPGRKRLVLRAGKERSIRNRHPWIFSGAIQSESGPDLAPFGDLFDQEGTLVASGFYSAKSQIRLRAWSFEEPVTSELIARRLAESIARRDALRTESTNAVRLVHSEGDGMSGLVVDLFNDVAVVEITSAGLEPFSAFIASELRNHLTLRALVFKNDLPSRKIEGLELGDVRMGAEAEEVEIVENGLRFVVALRGAQKTGFFIDQRENRHLARGLASGKSVLNLFSYSGAFGVSAVAGGAKSIEEVDISADALSLAKRNHELNSSGTTPILTASNAFEAVRLKARAGEKFDLVVCDPPAFAKSRADVEKAARGYKDINLYAMRLVESGGTLMTFSCSGHVDLDLFQKIIFSAAADAGRDAAIIARLGAGEDHPVSLYCPEGEYLKGLLLRFR